MGNDPHKAEKRREAEMLERFKVVGDHVKISTKTNAMRTTGAGSTSFTSTVMGNGTQGVNTRCEEIVYRNPKKKGYVRLNTTHGNVNVELHCDVAPRACENFITLCLAGYYDGVGFHRSIKNFMIQGGDPSGTGTGGQCMWGGKFKDEITHLGHSGRGVLSMANAGPHTNGSQFFILYKSARHLDGKHTVFGNVVGGMETLAAFEVFTNPYKEMAEEEATREAREKAREESEARERTEALNPGRWFSDPAGESRREEARRRGGGGKDDDDDDAVAGTKRAGGVGKYLEPPMGKQPAPAAASTTAAAAPGVWGGAKKKAKTSAGFGNFDGW